MSQHDETPISQRPTALGPSGPVTALGFAAGTRIGSYTIVKLIGQGGMGSVYLAEQERPHRSVALKLMRPGLASVQALRRFEHEAEVLGRLQHPGIAQIYEAGLHEGAPFFAMEYVEGKTLTDYAVSRKLGTRERLHLFAKVCEAVHHAHIKGVVHRDLKPGNILVTEVGEPPEPQPKVLDFGVARATDSDIQTTTLQTDIGQLIGTVPYMSPEQVAGDPAEVDTRSDVYALGVVLYELLAGRLPYDLKDRMIHEAARVIREDNPTRLSSVDTRLRGDIETIVGMALDKERDRRYQSALDLGSDIRRYLANEPIAARPPSTWYQLRKFSRRNRALVGGVAATFVVLVAGIVATSVFAVRAERANASLRMQNSRALDAIGQMLVESGDLDDLGLTPGGGSSETGMEADDGSLLVFKVWREPDGHQSIRFDRILGPGSGSDDIVVETLADYAVGSVRRAIATETERAREFEQVAEFQASQLSGIDAELMGARLREDLLAEARLEMERRALSEEDIVAASERLEELLARANLTNVALRSLERNIFDRALVAVDEKFTEQPLVRARLLQTLADTLRELGLLDRAVAPQTETLDIRRHVLGDEHPDTLLSISSMGTLLLLQGKLSQAEPYYREALESQRRVLGDEHPRTLDSINNIGFLLESQGKLAEAEPYYRNGLEVHRRVFGDEHPDTLGLINNMGVLLASQGKLAEAEPYYREAVEGCRRALGDDHPQTLTSISSIGYLLHAMGKLAEAELYCREAIEGYRRVLGDDHPDTLGSINNMGGLLESQGKLAEAEPYYREALEGYRRVLGDEHPKTLISINNMGGLLESQEKLTEAELYYREAMEVRRRVLGNEHPDTLVSIHNMAGLLRDLGRLENAQSLGAEAVELCRSSMPEGHWYLGVFLGSYGKTLLRLQRFDDAEKALVESQVIFEAALGNDHQRTIVVIKSLADLYTAWNEAEPGKGYDAKADEWRAKLKTLDSEQDGG